MAHVKQGVLLPLERSCARLKSNGRCHGVCGGDFNVVKYPVERLGASRVLHQMRQFNDFIQECELVDLPLRGTTYTWINNQD